MDRLHLEACPQKSVYTPEKFTLSNSQCNVIERVISLEGGLSRSLNQPQEISLVPIYSVGKVMVTIMIVTETEVHENYFI